MPIRPRPAPRAPGSAALGLALVAAFALGCPDPQSSGHQLFTSPQTNPLLVVEGEPWLAVANTTSGTVSIHDLRHLERADAGLVREIPTGLDPVSLAQRPGSREIWVANHISDSISVIDLDALDVVETIQDVDPDTGVTRTDAPVGVAFASPTRAFVTLDDANEVLVIDTDAAGRNAAITARLAIPAQAPRALTVADGRLYVAAFESENQTEFPTCAPDDPRLERNGGPGIDPSDPFDQGCAFATEVIESLNIDLAMDESGESQVGVDLELGTIFDFAAVNPNLGAEVIIDRDRPDRDLFVFDATTLALEHVVEHVGTLLYGVAATSDRLWVTNTDARNDRDGLRNLENRMFDNRLSYMDCGGGVCGEPVHVDLDANPAGVPIPTPYGVRASSDGSLLVVSVAGSDGRPGLPGDPATDIPGLAVLDGDGQLLGAVPTGAIPQGVALGEADGGPTTAYVLNTVDSTVSAVSLADPTRPEVLVTFPVGSDPTPPEVREGRIAFASARASTSGTFSCESCHPNGNTDQILWSISTIEGPEDFPADAPCDPFEEVCPEPRSTMPIRGLRDTLPLHWMGNLADPFEDLPGQLDQPEDAGAPDCDLATDGEVGCTRHLVDASLSGVMCDPETCPVGPSGLPGALDDDERNAMAKFLVSVSFPPSPERRPDDVLSPMAQQGVSDFFTDEDGRGVGTESNNIGDAVGFAPVTCADNAGGCHALPLTASTNSRTVGGFDAPSMRGIWDRFILFSNGVVSSEEWLRLAQACADGDPPGSHPGVTVNGVALDGVLVGDPCALRSPLLEGDEAPIEIPDLFGGAFVLDPFGEPSGETIYEPAVGMTERGQFMGTFEAVFHLAYGVRGAAMWQYFSEMSVGLPGLVGRQVSLDADTADDPHTLATLELMRQYAVEGRISLVARNRALGTRRFEQGRWRLAGAQPGEGITTAELIAGAQAQGGVYTVTAELPPGVRIGGADRQILLDVDPDARAREMASEIRPLPIPEPSAAGGDTIRLGAQNVERGARVLIDGELCNACVWRPGVAPETGAPVVDIQLGVALEPGVHVVQMLNPQGWMSNEMPILAR